MKRIGSAGVPRLNFADLPLTKRVGLTYHGGLRLATPFDRVLRAPEKFRMLDLKRRRAQIRARRILGLE
jgi:hypothetical protein